MTKLNLIHSILVAIDSFIESMTTLLKKAISRKFIVWIVASHMVYYSYLGPQEWLMISMIYMGSQAYIDSKKSREITNDHVGRPSQDSV